MCVCVCRGWGGGESADETDSVMSALGFVSTIQHHTFNTADIRCGFHLGASLSLITVTITMYFINPIPNPPLETDVLTHAHSVNDWYNFR